MLPWEKKLPEYLTNRRNTVSFILFTAAFALVFINIYSPFGVDRWAKDGNVTEAELFIYSSIVILIGMLVIVLSRILMYLFSRKQVMAYGPYALWIFGEIVVLALVYALIQWYYLQVGSSFYQVFRNTVRTTSFIIMLPYIISWLYLSFRDKYATLEKIEKSRMTDNEYDHQESRFSTSLNMIPFRDEKGILKFSIKKEDLLYIESADNYIIIHYFDHQKLSKYMVRTTLKRIEEEMPHSGLVRCHRSFMVNMDSVKVIRREKDGLIIGFDAPNLITVPISKTYLDGFIRKLSHYSAIDEKA